MANDFESFAKRMAVHGRTIEVNANDLARNVASRISKSLTMEDTPLDTGRARNNWQASTVLPIDTKVDKESFDKTGADRHAKNNEAIAQQVEGQTIYITNNLSYIKYLNEGSSKQAPAGFVEAAVMRANAFIAKASLLKPSKGKKV